MELVANVNNKTKYQAVVFDLDGTLLNTLEDLADSMNEALSRFGFPEHSLEEYRYFIGNGVDMLARKSLPEKDRNKAAISACVNAMREIYSKKWCNKTHVYKDISELLKALTIRGIKTAVLSNKPDDFTKLITAKFFSVHHFEVVFGQRPTVPKKPDPYAALEISRIIAIAPESILYVGDSDTDMITANSAGMYAVGALWGFRTADELLSNGAGILLEKPLDLLTLFS